MLVVGRFASRGGISVTVEAEHVRRKGGR